MGSQLVLCSEVVLFLEVTNVLSLWEVGVQLVLCSEVVLFSEVTNVLSLWEVGVQLVLCSEVVLFLEGRSTVRGSTVTVLIMGFFGAPFRSGNVLGGRGLGLMKGTLFVKKSQIHL